MLTSLKRNFSPYVSFGFRFLCRNKISVGWWRGLDIWSSSCHFLVGTDDAFLDFVICAYRPCFKKCHHQLHLTLSSYFYYAWLIIRVRHSRSLSLRPLLVQGDISSKFSFRLYKRTFKDYIAPAKNNKDRRELIHIRLESCQIRTVYCVLTASVCTLCIQIGLWDNF